MDSAEVGVFQYPCILRPAFWILPQYTESRKPLLEGAYLERGVETCDRDRTLYNKTIGIYPRVGSGGSNKQRQGTEGRAPHTMLMCERKEQGPRSSCMSKHNRMHACPTKSCMCDRMSMHIRAIRFAHSAIESPPCRGHGSSVCADSDPTDRPWEQLRHPPRHLGETPYLSTTVLRTNQTLCGPGALEVL